MTKCRSILGDWLEAVDPAAGTDELGTDQCEEADVGPDVVHNVARSNALGESVLQVGLGVAEEIREIRTCHVDTKPLADPTEDGRIPKAQKLGEARGDRMRATAPEL